jgi:predicted XRE-type DNA-binding protein
MADVKGRVRVEQSSGNVFAELGLKDAAEKKTRIRLAVAINDILRKSDLSQAAARLGINQPKISALANYRLEGFSVERLMNFSNALGRDVEIERRVCVQHPGRGDVSLLQPARSAAWCESTSRAAQPRDFSVLGQTQRP